MFAQFGFLNSGSRRELDLINMLIPDNKYTVDLFCNNNIFTKVWKTYESMTVKINGGSINTTHKSYVKGYGKVWFNGQSITNILSLKTTKSKLRVT